MRGHLRRTAFACLIGGLLALGLAPTPAQADTLVAQFDVPANFAPGINISGLDPSKFYRAEASGSYVYGGLSGIAVGDAGCHTIVNGEPMTRFAMGILLQRPGVLSVWVDGVARQWAPAISSPLGCDDPLLGGDHEYTLAFKPTSSTVNFRIDDTWHGDNAGSIHIDLFELDGPPIPAAPIPVGAAFIDSASPTGSSVPLLSGLTYVAEASGTYRYTTQAADLADASCSRTVGDPTYIVDRYGLLGGLPWLDLVVDGAGQDWEPQPGNGSCASDTHTYRAAFSPAASGPVSFRIHDAFYGDNSGVLQVAVFLVPPLP